MTHLLSVSHYLMAPVMEWVGQEAPPRGLGFVLFVLSRWSQKRTFAGPAAQNPPTLKKQSSSVLIAVRKWNWMLHFASLAAPESRKHRSQNVDSQPEVM